MTKEPKKASLIRAENLTPEQQDQWTELAKEGKKKIGGRITVVEGQQGKLPYDSALPIEAGDDD
jgi:hypothetical protein